MVSSIHRSVTLSGTLQKAVAKEFAAKRDKKAIKPKASKEQTESIHVCAPLFLNGTPILEAARSLKDYFCNRRFAWCPIWITNGDSSSLCSCTQLLTGPRSPIIPIRKCAPFCPHRPPEINTVPLRFVFPPFLSDRYRPHSNNHSGTESGAEQRLRLEIKRAREGIRYRSVFDRWVGSSRVSLLSQRHVEQSKSCVPNSTDRPEAIG